MPLRILIAGDVFFAAYIAAIATLLSHSNHAASRDLVSRNDEGLAVIAVTTVVAVALSLGSIFALLNTTRARRRFDFRCRSRVFHWPGSCCTRYALSIMRTCFYGPDTGTDNRGRDLRFPGGDDPRAWDFLYYALVVGMTA